MAAPPRYIKVNLSAKRPLGQTGQKTYYMAGLRKSSLIVLLAFVAGFALQGQKVRAVIVGVADYRHDALVDDLHFTDDDAHRTFMTFW